MLMYGWRRAKIILNYKSKEICIAKLWFTYCFHKKFIKIDALEGKYQTNSAGSF